MSRRPDGVGAGDIFFIYDPDRNLEPKQRFHFGTIVTKDYPGWDESSDLNRPGVYRLNIGVSRDTYRRLFPPAEAPALSSSSAGSPESASALPESVSASPESASATPAAQLDYAALDQLMRHPAYAAQSWLGVLNPSADTFASLKPLLDEAYNQAVKRITARGAAEKSS